MSKIYRFLSIISLIVVCATFSFGQERTKSSILMRSEVIEGKIMLRWVATDAKAWLLLNKYGVRLERVTLSREGVVLDEQEVTILVESLKPEESQEFKQLATTDSYAAIIAQAIFGERFEVSGSGESGVAQIIAMGEELQQRFAISLYAADLSYLAADVAGWGWTDGLTKENERYLYRVVPLVPQKELEIAAGAIFVDPGRKDRFPKPLDFRGDFKDGSVLMNWNYRTLEELYVAYILERSKDGTNFESISQTPITEMAPGSDGEIIYADTIVNNTTYYYRLSGITPFGTHGEYSETISGMGHPKLKNAPRITKAIPDENASALIEWEFDPADQSLITGFSIERSDDNSAFTTEITSIDPSLRSTTLKNLHSSNYLVVAANMADGTKMRSLSVLVQPSDTIPPSIPKGLVAIADTTGAVKLSWQPNTDPDIYGYRIYKAMTEGEELIPLNDIAIRETFFVDSVDLNMLNSKVYYAITALDERYNQSGISPIVEVTKPETIPPTSPLIIRIDVENGKNTIHWASGAEPNIAAYIIYRALDSDENYAPIATIDDTALSSYEDTDVKNNKKYSYMVVSKTVGKLYSEPSSIYKVTAININKSASSKLEFLTVVSKNKIELSWKNIPSDVINIQIYKKRDGDTLELFKDNLAAESHIEDTNVVPGVSYQYMLVVKSNNAPVQTITKTTSL